MIARLLAKRVPWRIEFGADGSSVKYVYEFGPYVMCAFLSNGWETVTVRRDEKDKKGKEKVVVKSIGFMTCDGSDKGAKRRAEMWLYENNEVLMRSYL